MGQLPQSFTVFLFRFNLQTDLQDRREDMIIPMLYAKRWRLLEHKCSPHITQSPVRQPIWCCNPGFLPPNPAAFYQVSCFHKHSSWAKTLPIHYSIVSGHLKSRNVSQASVSILILERKKQRFCKCAGLLRILCITTHLVRRKNELAHRSPCLSWMLSAIPGTAGRGRLRANRPQFLYLCPRQMGRSSRSCQSWMWLRIHLNPKRQTATLHPPVGSRPEIDPPTALL